MRSPSEQPAGQTGCVPINDHPKRDYDQPAQNRRWRKKPSASMKYRHTEFGEWPERQVDRAGYDRTNAIGPSKRSPHTEAEMCGNKREPDPNAPIQNGVRLGAQGNGRVPSAPKDGRRTRAR